MRLSRDYKAIQKSPIPYIETHPSAKNILVWPYVITGPPDTPYVGGQYYGHLTFPKNFPYAPPSIAMMTPSGRFHPGAHVCTTFTSMHPEEWNPAWTVESILTGFLSFMTSNEVGAGTIYQAQSPEERSLLAKASKRWNSLEYPKFLEEFPELHAANLVSETFTKGEMKKCKAKMEKTKKASKSDTSNTAVSGQEVLQDTSYESFMSEDWEKYGTMEDDFDYYDDEEDDNEMKEEEYETSDTEMDTEEKD